MKKRPPKDQGAVREVYAGSRHMGAVKVLSAGFQARHDDVPDPLGIFDTEAAANRAIYDTDLKLRNPPSTEGTRV